MQSGSKKILARKETYYNMTELREKRRKAGRRGGLQTLKRYGRKHFKKIGRWGAHVMHSTYHLAPVDQNDFAIVRRNTGEVVAYLSGRPRKELEEC